jgi:hypothetical protein
VNPIEQLEKVADTVDKLFLEAFDSVPVRCDETLTENKYYVAVSKELFERLTKK